MKRSEMVTYFHNLINTYQGGANFNRSQIDEILKNLEQMGMNPPKRLWPLHEVLTPMLPMMSYTWEPEDETISKES